MADRCPHCGVANPENLPFCNNCGEPIDKHLQFVMDVQNSVPEHREPQRKSRYDDDDNDFLLSRDDDDEEEKKFSTGLILVAVAVVAVVLWFVLK